MARRRSPMDSDPDSAFDPSGPGGGITRGEFGISPEERLRRQIQADRDAGVFDDPIAGSPDAPRDIFAPSNPRTLTPPAAARPASGVEMDADGITPRRGPLGSGGPNLDAIIGALPQGVEASGGAQGGAGPAENAPPFSTAPAEQSVSLRGVPPASMAGPKRQSISSPSLYGSGPGGRNVIGRGSGLTGGGLGMPGGPSGGPQATEEMLALLKALGLG